MVFFSAPAMRFSWGRLWLTSGPAALGYPLGPCVTQRLPGIRSRAEDIASYA